MHPCDLEVVELLLGVLYTAIALSLTCLFTVACGIYLGVLIALAVPLVVMTIYFSEHGVAILLAN